MNREDIKKAKEQIKEGKITPGNYLKDKNGWVTSYNGKQKIKLRKHIKNYVDEIKKFSDKKRTVILEELIFSYNQNGLKGLILYKLEQIELTLKKLEDE